MESTSANFALGLRQRTMQHAVSRWRTRSLVGFLGVGIAVVMNFLAVLTGSGASPVLEHLYPVSVTLGETGMVQVIGSWDPWPPKVWCSDPAVQFTPETNAGRFKVFAPSIALPGARWVRLYSEQGASAARFLVLTKDRATAEVEPNDDPAKAQRIERLPAVVNGRLDKSGDMDSYAFELTAGQTLVATVEAYVLASPMDAALRLVDPQGIQVTWNHDDGVTLDPKLTWTATVAGRYVLQVFGFPYPANSDVRFGGGNSFVYRLHLHSGPYLHHLLPLGVQRGADGAVRAIASNVASNKAPMIEVKTSGLRPEETTVRVGPPNYENEIEVEVSEGKELMEVEPNDVPSAAMKLTLPVAVTGRMESGSDLDRFQFEAKKGEVFSFVLSSARLGFPLDAWLRLETVQGKEIQRSDDDTGADPAMTWTAPDDGSYLIVVGSLLRRIGEGAYYRLAVTHPKPTLRLTVTSDVFTLNPGETNTVTVTAKREQGANQVVMLRAESLPPGIQCSDVELGEKAGEAQLKLIATTNAEPASVTWKLSGIEKVTGKRIPIVRDFVTSGSDNGVPNGFSKLLLRQIDALWLTIPPRPPAPPAKPKP